LEHIKRGIKEKLQSQSALNVHRAKTKSCIELQIKKLGKPLSEINKEKKAAEEARKAKKKAEKAERDKKKAEKDKKKAEAEKEKSRKASEKAYREAEEEIAKKEKEIVTESDDDSEIDENAEIPLSSSSENESSSSSESEEEEHYKVKEQAKVKEEFDNIENYQRTNPSRLNNLFKKKSTTIKTEIIREDQPPEVHKRKIEECLQPVKQEPVDCVSNEAPLDKLGPVTPTIDIKALSEDINKKVNSSIVSLETKINSLIDVMGKVTVSISSLEKRMKSIEASVDIETIGWQMGTHPPARCRAYLPIFLGRIL
jgi:hypothetical protein